MVAVEVEMVVFPVARLVAKWGAEALKVELREEAEAAHLPIPSKPVQVMVVVRPTGNYQKIAGVLPWRDSEAAAYLISPVGVLLAQGKAGSCLYRVRSNLRS